MATKTLPENLTTLVRGAARRAIVAAMLTFVAAGVSGAQASTYFELASSPAAAASRRAAADLLATDVKAAMNRVRGSGTWGVMVVSLSNGDTLFDHNAERMLLPASTMKLFTSALALDRFGPNGRFETQLLHTGSITNGVLHGDLILRGAGDPTLGGSPAVGDVSPPMAVLARAVANAGVTRVTGSIIGDASEFDDGKVPEGWKRRYLHASYAARVSALSFNENRIGILVKPTGKAAAVRFRPAISGVGITNTVRIVANSRSARIVVTQDSVKGTIKVSGWIGALSAERNYQLVVENPALFAVGALKAALEKQGVQVDGPIRRGEGLGIVAPVATIESPTLEQMIMQMNGKSNNHFAELLFRSVGRSIGERGSATMSNTMLGQFLVNKVRVDSETVFAADGSGLSTLDRVTPRALVQLLNYAKTASWWSSLEQSLPIAGKTETLARRMRRTPAMGNLRAKTGSTNDIASLGGYVTAGNGEDLAFAIIYNGTDLWRAREAIDRIGVTLASFSR
ncbi:MAG: D-alanyl-D-alanine carboxypeptidase/D-alanyl-D-alanine-endopeptidase [Gemmatimonadetes bacterium]|nr:D-alanyl-D-alanine carboxypeptidase/D-alanyl-D-alanine-endopeptidase [Gemmatimonadota bacterium]